MDAKNRKRSPATPAALRQDSGQAASTPSASSGQAGPGQAIGMVGQFDADRQRRLELEALNGALARKKCTNCATIGAWAIYNQERSSGRVRYVKCKACGANDQAPIIVKEAPHEAS